jgi:curved DNA-binding protein CbpA
MVAPLLTEPYIVLGLAEDANISAIRREYLKLGLKRHPGRMRDETEQARAGDEFEKAQEAWELLRDPISRSKYDDKVKSVKFKEGLTEGSFTTRTASYPMRPLLPILSREHRNGSFSERSAPTSSYFQESYRYFEEPPRPSSTEYEEYDRRSSVDREEKGRKSSKRPGAAATDTPFDAVDIEVEPRSTPYRQDSGRSTQTQSSSPRESSLVGRHNGKHGRKLFAEVDCGPYTVRYPNVQTSPRINEKDIKYSRDTRRPRGSHGNDDPHNFQPEGNHVLGIQPRSHPLYQKSKDPDGLYRCPFQEESKCNHEPTAQKCGYE